MNFLKATDLIMPWVDKYLKEKTYSLVVYDSFAIWGEAISKLYNIKGLCNESMLYQIPKATNFILRDEEFETIVEAAKLKYKAKWSNYAEIIYPTSANLVVMNISKEFLNHEVELDKN